MALNPYASFLAEQDPRAVIASTPSLIDQAVCELTPHQIQVPVGPGKWSPCQIVSHLADCELVFGVRLRQTLAISGPTIQPFDQDIWAERYVVYDLASALDVFRAARAWNVKLIAGVTPAEFGREMTHPERGTMTFQTVVETMAGHDLNHLAQLQSLRFEPVLK